MDEECPIIGVNRHRIDTDGKGVVTLVVFAGCPLRCRYCINPLCHSREYGLETVTPDSLLEDVEVDNLYFLATGGGVTFGGGEPALRSCFIEQFCRLGDPGWRITVETSLNVDKEHVERLARCVDFFIVDVKDMDPEIYRAYTGADNAKVTANLEMLADIGRAGDVLIRLPRIPGYNAEANIADSRRVLQKMGYEKFDEFNYRVL